MRKKRFFRRAVYEYPEQLFVAERDPSTFAPWISELKGKKSLVLELGMGSGDFLCQHAEEHPDLFYLGVEIKPDRIYRALEKARQRGLQNIAFLQTPIERILEYQLPDLERIFILFPDPWPKDRHEPRRLTSRTFLKTYQDLLTPGGQLCFKTDDAPLFEYSVESFSNHGWTLDALDRNYQTEKAFQTLYEQRFRRQDKPIHYVVAYAPHRVFWKRFSLRKSFRPLLHFLTRS